MTRAHFLERVKQDNNKYGFTQEETKKAYGLSPVRISDKAWDRAVHEGREAREKRYKAVGYWEAADHESKCRQELIRSIQCGDRLDTKEAGLLVDKLHTAKQRVAGLAARLAEEEALLP